MSEETTAFANAMVFDGTSDELREGCVRVAADVIVEVGEGPKAGDRVIDCRERAVIPGLIDAHFHAYGASLSLLEIETSSLSYLAWRGRGGWLARWAAGLPRSVIQVAATRAWPRQSGKGWQRRPGTCSAGPR